MADYISAKEALDELDELLSSGRVSQEAIEELVSKVSVVDKDATTILYTAGKTMGAYQGEINSVRCIGNTEAYDLLTHKEYNRIITEQIKNANGVGDDVARQLVDD